MNKAVYSILGVVSFMVVVGATATILGVQEFKDGANKSGYIAGCIVGAVISGVVIFGPFFAAGYFINKYVKSKEPMETE